MQAGGSLLCILRQNSRWGVWHVRGAAAAAASLARAAAAAAASLATLACVQLGVSGYLMYEGIVPATLASHLYG